MFTYTNRVVNYPLHIKSEARKLVSDMSESRKQALLDSIKLQQGVNNLTDQPYDANMLNYVAKLLQ